MEFALSEDQRMLQDSISGFLKDNASLDTIRKIADGDAEAKATLAAGLSEMGIKLHLSEVKGPVMDRLERSHFLDELSGQVFLSQYDAHRTLTGRPHATAAK